ncbi:MAG TPA: four-carbon acid sugar kinase family protein [Candidatus Limnocylindria bacterium]|nr:four-carbon acid sugar kinase family protein [Candidatus Limnocylindria bacterium]
MAPTSFLPLTILADDLTGACDTGALFAGGGVVPVTVWPAPARPAPVAVVDTETRAQPAAAAAARVRTLVAAAPRARYFKKIDSTLRGRIGAEVAALLDATGARSAIICPALPSEGRAVVDRVLFVGGLPVAETPVAGDPEFPARGTSSVVDLLRPDVDRPLAWIPLAQVRAGVASLSARMVRLTGTVVVADAERDEDLDALVQAALPLATPPLLVGAAGLARALAAALGLLRSDAEIPAGRRWLIVAGSAHPATRAQIAAARAAGLTVLATADEPERDRAAAARLAPRGCAALAGGGYDVVVVTGGETAVALYHALGAERIDLLGTPCPGLAFGHFRLGARTLAVVTKAGGFGLPDLFVTLAHAHGAHTLRSSA